MKKVHAKTINDLNLSVRAYNILARNSLYTIEEIKKLTETDIFRLKGIGHYTHIEIIAKLHAEGVNLRR